MKKRKHSFLNFIISFLKSAAFFIFCVLLSAAIAIPLCYFSSSSPFIYTIVFLSIITAIILFFIIRKAREFSLSENLKAFLIFFISIVGSAATFLLVIYELAVFGIILFVSAAIFVFLIAKFYKTKPKNE